MPKVLVTIENFRGEFLAEASTVNECLSIFMEYGWEEDITLKDISKEHSLLVKSNGVLCGVLTPVMYPDKVNYRGEIQYHWRYLNLEGEKRHFHKVELDTTYSYCEK
jgi:hypothetical protein